MKHHAVPVDVPLTDLEHVIETFRALSDATRTRIVLLLAQHDHSVGELVKALELPQSTVSRHLAVLRAADLVSTERKGASIFYHLRDSHLGELVHQAFSHAQHKRLGLEDHREV